MDKQEFILQLSKEGREWVKSLAPFLASFIAWLIPSPFNNRKKKPNEPIT